MNFETTDPNCELFLCSEGVGFLMLSSSGSLLRKWHGLIVGETSICAGMSWSLGHGENLSELKPDQWIATHRSISTLSRHWLAGCGCRLEETWDWSSPRELKNTLRVTQRSSCVAGKTSPLVVYARPLWTLSAAGHPTCGDINPQLSTFPAAKATLSITSKSLPEGIDVRCQKTNLEVHSEIIPGEWQPLPDAHRHWISTPQDTTRGESADREVLVTHEFRAELRESEQCEIHFLFNEQNSNRKTLDKNCSLQIYNFSSESQPLTDGFINSAWSLNQLIRSRSDGQLGLQAGLPWFTQFWTRDMCHSYRAAFLWSGRHGDGETLLTGLWKRSRGMAIPNYTTTHTTTNNSIDALPLLLLTTADFVDFCGWTSSLKGEFLNIERCLRDGARIFSEGGLVRHGPADTWMDAQKDSPLGLAVPCSPRADRAFEIQAFWIAALRRWSVILRVNDNIELAHLLHTASERGLKTLRSCYMDDSGQRWADTLRPDGSADFSLRPNVLLGLHALQSAQCMSELLSTEELHACLSHMIEMDLIVPYGVRTLSPETSVKHPQQVNSLFGDESAYIHENKIHFHPYHEFGSRKGLEHPDWAYHNGTIWPWLSAACSDLLLTAEMQEPADSLLQTLIHHSTKGSQGGALPELLDGLSSHSVWSWAKGAPHQAWSEAALIHMVIESWIGLKVFNFGRELSLNTSQWKKLPDFSFEFSLPEKRVQIQKSSGNCELLIRSPKSESMTLSHSRNRHWSDKSVHEVTSNQPFRLKLSISEE